MLLDRQSLLCLTVYPPIKPVNERTVSYSVSTNNTGGRVLNFINYIFLQVIIYIYASYIVYPIFPGFKSHMNSILLAC